MDPEQIKAGVLSSAEHSTTGVTESVSPHIDESGDLAQTQEAQKKLSALMPGAGAAAESVHTTNLSSEVDHNQFEVTEKKANPSETVRSLDEFEKHRQEKIAHNLNSEDSGIKAKPGIFEQAANFFGGMFGKKEQPVQPVAQTQTVAQEAQIK